MNKLKSLTLTQRQLCDIELILNGGFAPLMGFMTRLDYESVLSTLRLQNGVVWPMPIILDITDTVAESIECNEEIALYDAEGLLIAWMHVRDKWLPDKKEEAMAVFGTLDQKHPGVNYLFNQTKSCYLGGQITRVNFPYHYDFQHLRYTPKALRAIFAQLNWHKIIGFQTRNPMHRAHLELTLQAAELCDANLLLHPVVGMTKPGDIDHFTRVRCYEKLLPYYTNLKPLLCLLPLAMRMAGPREALWHAIIRKNYGCTHFIVGRDHAGPGKDSRGHDFYEPYAAQALVADYQHEVGIEMVPFQEMVYVANRSNYKPVNEIQEGDHIEQISGTTFRRLLQEGAEIPTWFSYPDIIEELRKSYPPKRKQGFTLFFTGLSGAGKSSLANALLNKLMEMGGRSITLLDGDLIRKNLSSELGFSKEHRDLNILRIGFVAAEITKHRGIAICAPIAPYQTVRKQVREMVSEYGGFIEIYLSTPLQVCESRDRKGLYAKARAGQIKGFTGIDDPYEVPENPELVLDTSDMSLEKALNKILQTLKNLEYID
jgi:sulfate adenylyltransferase